MTPRALVIIADGFEDVEAVAPIDVLNRVGVDVVIAGLHSATVAAAYGTVINAHTTLDRLEGTFDAVVLPGGMKNAEALGSDDRVRNLVRQFCEEKKLVASICASPSYVLGASAGILNGRRATGDQGCNEKLANSGAIVTGEKVSRDGNIITGMGPGAALLFGLVTAAYLVGEEKLQALAAKWGMEDEFRKAIA